MLACYAMLGPRRSSGHFGFGSSRSLASPVSDRGSPLNDSDERLLRKLAARHKELTIDELQDLLDTFRNQLLGHDQDDGLHTVSSQQCHISLPADGDHAHGSAGPTGFQGESL